MPLLLSTTPPVRAGEVEEQAQQIEATFKHGLQATAEGKYEEAIKAYQSILGRHPGLTRVRLELARTYFLDRDYDRAELQFQLVEGDKNLPPEVVEKVDMFLERIRRQKNWTVDFGFGIVPDSNLNQASGRRQECLATSFGTLCRPLESKDSGIGVRLNLSGNRYRRLTRNWGVRSTAGLYITEFPVADYDDYTLYLASGPRYIFGRGEASFQSTYQKRWYAGNGYGQSYGLRADGSVYATQNISLQGGGAWRRNRYDDAAVDGFLNGDTWEAYVRPRYILNSRSFVQAGLDYAADSTEAESHASDTWTYSLGYYTELPWSFTAYAEVGYAAARYRAPQNFIDTDALVKSRPREDGIRRFGLTLSPRAFEYKGLTPAVRYTYTDRRSNIPAYEYDKHRGDLVMDVRF